MKKIFVLLIVLAVALTVNAQPDIIDSSQVVRVAGKILSPTDFNVLLSKKIRQNYNAHSTENILRAYAGFVDTTMDNTYKKIIDSTYDIYINNLCKDIFLVYNNLDWHYYNVSQQKIGPLYIDNSLPAKESDHLLSRGINRIRYKMGAKMITYEVMSFNPYDEQTKIFLYKVKDLKFGPEVRAIIFHYKIPKPVPVIITTDNKLIAQKKQNPSANLASNIQYDPSKKFDTIFRKGDSVLFVFEHFARQLRNGYNDNLQYKLDSASDWSYTALSYAPSILLENLPAGSHTLYVKYATKNSDVLIYRFQIVPN